ncbi:hypothetical protein [Bradyrhizobium sp. B039]|uniref:hypothetical protein n=1 Tax=Bradyrhizobium sp. B039 TaxID=3140239 RepID=UPI0031843916
MTAPSNAAPLMLNVVKLNGNYSPKSPGMNEISITDALQNIKSWATKAEQVQAANYPDVQPLRYLLPQARRSILGVDASLSEYQGQAVIGFGITGGANVGTKTRYVLPIHFAILRAFELVPGVTVRLNDDAHISRDRKRGITRSDDELIFNLGIRLKATVAKVLGLPKRSKLDRILFSAPPDAILHPRRTGDHHYVVPSGYVPIRNRHEGFQTQETWIAGIERIIRNPASSELGELPDTLRSLFMTAESWHWSELVDRLPCDPRIDSRNLRGKG